MTVDGVQKYGGDFEGELTHDGNFCCDGLVFADRSLKAGSLEAKAAYQPIRTTYEDGVLKIYNRLDFTNLDEYEFTFTIEADGQKVYEEKKVLVAEPHTTIEVEIPYEEMKCCYGVYLNTSLTKDGKEYAKTQHALPWAICDVCCDAEPSCNYAETECPGDVKVAADGECDDIFAPIMVESDYDVTISGEGFTYIFSKHYGAFTSMVVDGEEQLAGKSVLSAFRAPVDNDRNIIVRWANINIWEGENLDCAFSKIYDCYVEDGVIKLNGSLAGVSRIPVLHFEQTIAVSVAGEVSYELKAKVRKDAIWLPRLGFEFELPAENSAFTYYGRGPIESYCDLHNWAPMGLYTSDAEKEYVNYVRPQEHGNHTEVKMLQIGKLEFVAADKMEINVSKYSTAALYKAEHTDELVADGKTHLRIDYKVSGVGSNSCGPELEEEYRLAEKEIKFGFTIKPLSE